jgi:spermidine/putrescine transport system permease protein
MRQDTAAIDPLAAPLAAPARRTRRRAERRLLLLVPALAILGLLLIVPLGIMVVYSFLIPATFGGVVWQFSPGAYVQFLFERDIFDDTLVFTSAYLEIYLRSFVQALVATAGCLLIGLPTAYFMATRPREQRNLWVFLITVPYWVNLLIRTLAMLFLIRDEGPLNALLLWLGAIEQPLTIAYTNRAIAIGLIYSYLPFMVLPIYATVERFDFRLIEAAYDLYADRWTVFRRIILPLAAPGIVAGCLLVFIPSLGAFIAPDILGGGRNLMIGNMIALQFGSSRNWPFGAAAAVILMSMVLLALMLYARAEVSGAGPQRQG